MAERIGFVGLGQMGQPMALNLLQTGYKLRVFDVRQERMAPLVAQGAEPGASPGEVTIGADLRKKEGKSKTSPRCEKVDGDRPNLISFLGSNDVIQEPS